MIDEEDRERNDWMSHKEEWRLNETRHMMLCNKLWLMCVCVCVCVCAGVRARLSVSISLCIIAIYKMCAFVTVCLYAITFSFTPFFLVGLLLFIKCLLPGSRSDAMKMPPNQSVFSIQFTGSSSSPSSPTSIPPPPFTPSLISLMVSVDVKHHVYLLVIIMPQALCSC